MRRWRGVIAVEGRVSEDGRLVEPMALAWDGPLPLYYGGTHPEQWSTPIIGTVEHIERVVTDAGPVLLLGDGPLFGEMPEESDLGVSVDSVTFISGELTDTFTVRHARIRAVWLGSPRIWDECVCEVYDAPE